MPEHMETPSAPIAPVLQAVLFDMDGVVTDTAQAHAAAWQRLFDDYLRRRAERLGEPFRPFDPKLDYRQYVDGKPRLDGISSFLASRGIELPQGEENDSADQESLWALGKRKDYCFKQWLDANAVRVYPGTLALIKQLRAAGVSIAVFSSSRNTEAVLTNAGLEAFFDATVDGNDLARLGLPGKPEPAMLLEAARRLNASPLATAVFEDAIAGITAAVQGGFALVIGVDRGDAGAGLAGAGAHLVVHDLAEMQASEEKVLQVKTLDTLPCAWQREDELRQRLAGKKLAVFLDYDGTLTPIVEDHTRALLAAEMRQSIASLAKLCPVTIVSGRDLRKLQELVELDGVWYAGSHGFDIAGPADTGEHFEQGAEFLEELDKLEQALVRRLTAISGHTLERKRFSIAVHYRQVKEAELVASLREILDKTLADYQGLRLTHGKKVFEIRPDIQWDKGRAVTWILQQLKLDRADVMPLYIGDDITDEDAFQLLCGRGFSVAVRYDETRQSAADYSLADTEQVRAFLDRLSEIVAGQSAKRAAE